MKKVRKKRVRLFTPRGFVEPTPQRPCNDERETRVAIQTSTQHPGMEINPQSTTGRPNNDELGIGVPHEPTWQRTRDDTAFLSTLEGLRGQSGVPAATVADLFGSDSSSDESPPRHSRGRIRLNRQAWKPRHPERPQMEENEPTRQRTSDDTAFLSTLEGLRGQSGMQDSTVALLFDSDSSSDEHPPRDSRGHHKLNRNARKHTYLLRQQTPVITQTQSSAVFSDSEGSIFNPPPARAARVSMSPQEAPGRVGDDVDEAPMAEEGDQDQADPNTYEDRLFPAECVDYIGRESIATVEFDLDSFTCLSQYAGNLFEDVGTAGSFIVVNTCLYGGYSNLSSRFSISYRNNTALRPRISSSAIGRNQMVIGLGSYPNFGE